MQGPSLVHNHLQKSQLLIFLSSKGVWSLFEQTWIPIFKLLAFTLTAYCYGSKSVTQPDASSKRYLWDKISC